MTAKNEWTRKDAWLGLLFLVFGILVVLYTVGAMKNDAPAILWWAGWLLGPIMVLLGGNAVWKSLRAGPPGGSGAGDASGRDRSGVL